MLEVKISMSRGKIALVQSASENPASYSFYPQSAQEVIHKILLEKGANFGRLRESLDDPSCYSLVEKIIRAQNRINCYRAAEIEAEAFYLNEEDRWVVKVFNPFGKFRLLPTEICNSFLIELKQQKVLRFQDNSIAHLNDAQLDSLISRLHSVRQLVIEMNKPLTEEKPWLRETVILTEIEI